MQDRPLEEANGVT